MVSGICAAPDIGITGAMCPWQLKPSCREMDMLKSAKLASVVMLLVVGGCAAEEIDDGIEPACTDDAKCDAASNEGFEIFKGADGKYYFHLEASNGRIVLRSQGYTTKASATKGVESVRLN